jgi:hypothetical protein
MSSKTNELEESTSVHKNMLWTRYAIVALGMWLAASCATVQTKSLVVASNDIITGILLIIFGIASISQKRTYAPWVVCLLGIWLQLAPLVFWAKNPATYLNDTIVGALAIAFSILIPGTPGVVESGPEIPPGWSYNPSSWAQRLPVAFLALLCCFTARYMASYQLGYIDTIWDPIFQNGTYFVITSDISKSFPVSDAGLGAAAYIIEALLALKGGTRRWHTMPWIVALFGFLVVPVGLVSIILIMLQPLVVGHWCSWCLFTALCMLLMIAFTVDEVAASSQFLKQARKDGLPFWKTFWHGRKMGEAADTRSPDLDSSFTTIFQAMCWGITIPWNLVASALIGIWLMFYPDLYALGKDIAVVDHIVGALVTALSVITIAEVIRNFRYINILFGAIIAVSALLFHESTSSLLTHSILAVLLIILSFPKGKINKIATNKDEITR